MEVDTALTSLNQSLESEMISKNGWAIQKRESFRLIRIVELFTIPVPNVYMG